MKSINSIFKNGHFYNLETGKRIHFKDGSEMIMLINSPEDIYKVDPNNLPNSPLSDNEKLEKIKSSGYFNYKKIFDAEQILYFNINAGFKKDKGSQKVSCCFELRLEEDLYVYQRESRIKEGLLVDCACVVQKLHSGSLAFFEPIYGYSLNDVYTKTFVYYFGTFGKGTADIYEKVTFEPGDKYYPLEKLRMF